MTARTGSPGLDDYRWIVSSAARPWLQRAQQNEAELVSLIATLRRDLPAPRAHLVVQQTRLRRRAEPKFDKAGEMFFTPVGLEQATDQRIAFYKGRRFPTGTTTADLACGIGGDLLGLASRGETVGVDRDPVACIMAEANCRIYGFTRVELVVTDVERFQLSKSQAWHVDPDRRPLGHRTVRAELHSPDLQTLCRLVRSRPHAAIQLAPAADPPELWHGDAEWEWIGRRGECKQLMIWLGHLARYPGCAVATVLHGDLPEARSVKGVRDLPGPVARRLGRYVFEPHPAVRAARLTGVLALQHQLSLTDGRSPYLTGDRLICDPALATFDILEQLPMDLKRLRSAVRRRNLGRLEIKTRSVPHDPEVLRRKLRGSASGGDDDATLLILNIAERYTAVLARRVSP